MWIDFGLKSSSLVSIPGMNWSRPTASLLGVLRLACLVCGSTELFLITASARIGLEPWSLEPNLNLGWMKTRPGAWVCLEPGAIMTNLMVVQNWNPGSQKIVCHLGLQEPPGTQNTIPSKKLLKVWHTLCYVRIMLIIVYTLLLYVKSISLQTTQRMLEGEVARLLWHSWTTVWF